MLNIIGINFWAARQFEFKSVWKYNWVSAPCNFKCSYKFYSSSGGSKWGAKKRVMRSDENATSDVILLYNLVKSRVSVISHSTTSICVDIYNRNHKLFTKNINGGESLLKIKESLSRIVVVNWFSCPPSNQPKKRSLWRCVERSMEFWWRVKHYLVVKKFLLSCCQLPAASSSSIHNTCWVVMDGFLSWLFSFHSPPSKFTLSIENFKAIFLVENI